MNISSDYKFKRNYFFFCRYPVDWITVDSGWFSHILNIITCLNFVNRKIKSVKNAFTTLRIMDNFFFFLKKQLVNSSDSRIFLNDISPFRHCVTRLCSFFFNSFNHVSHSSWSGITLGHRWENSYPTLYFAPLLILMIQLIKRC